MKMSGLSSWHWFVVIFFIMAFGIAVQTICTRLKREKNIRELQDKTKQRAVKGWLLVLQVYLAFQFVSVYFFVASLTYIQQEHQATPYSSLLLFLGIASISILIPVLFVCARAMQAMDEINNPQVVLKLFRAIWSIAASSILIESMYAIAFWHLGHFDNLFFAQIFVTALIAGAWSNYLFQSERVHSTYIKQDNESSLMSEVNLRQQHLPI
jgi:formate-dependent nitrite reductase membrane component NrfD